MLHRAASRDPIWLALYSLGTLLVVALINVVVVRQWTLVTTTSSQTHGVLLDGVRRTPAAVAVVVLLSLATGLWFVPLIGIPRAHWIWAAAVLSVPSTYLGVALSCAWVALLIDARGVFASLRYSFQLVLGNWWRTSTIYSVAFATVMVFCILVGVVATVIGQFVGTEDLAVITAIFAVAVVGLAAVGVPFFSAVILAVYADLEARRRGIQMQPQVADATSG
jgi:hypothetical protein